MTLMPTPPDVPKRLVSAEKKILRRWSLPGRLSFLPPGSLPGQAGQRPWRLGPVKAETSKDTLAAVDEG